MKKIEFIVFKSGVTDRPVSIVSVNGMGANGLPFDADRKKAFMIPVLFARKDSIYKSLGCDVWDIERDARKWEGGNPCIAHPPCRAWAKLKGFARPLEGEKELAILSVKFIREFGGILEHPSGSSLWKYIPLPLPGSNDEWGGYSICVDQFQFGHKARKKTLLYIVGVPKSELPPIPIRMDAVTHYVGFPKSWKGKSRNGMKEVTKKEREATPELLAKWLIQVCQIIKSKQP